MHLDLSTVEEELHNWSYLQQHSFKYAGTEVEDAGTPLETQWISFLSPASSIAIEFCFAPPQGEPFPAPAPSMVFLTNRERENSFSLGNYSQQHHGLKSDDVGRYSESGGTFREQFRNFLDLTGRLLGAYAQPLLSGKVWPYIDFHWTKQQALLRECRLKIRKARKGVTNMASRCVELQFRWTVVLLLLTINAGCGGSNAEDELLESAREHVRALRNEGTSEEEIVDRVEKVSATVFRHVR